MARYNYFNTGDSFSEWHREHDGISYIDIDWVEICKYCKKILLVGETAKYCGHYRKNFYVTQEVARVLNVLGLLVFYDINKDGKIIQFRYQIINPCYEKRFHILEPAEFLKVLRAIHSDHEKTNCKRRKK